MSAGRPKEDKLIEPSGEKIYFEHPESNSGGKLDIDRNRQALTSLPIENIYWPIGSAPRGSYVVQVLFYKRNQNSISSVPVSIQVKVAGTTNLYTGQVSSEQEVLQLTQFSF
jgi:uncharacterized protein YfaP (DUF2135 family)